ncbi:sigma-54-dependent Fis family transcriptional regulator [Desulforhopalus vacuolatus]|uniref:sigma-54-dependent transcriptional regulator n=1 Tax=Desulforhopalus vacuolatus TaxID=40414 RepID=UPI00196547B7|nr:sigma-54 dependent transcriptional regulator [Desulforhopalus vacuolatus]MBM9520226.1 sigma-54-dependent Fis family transcriptional regulator [Desulforhopalus vacuolatus]
MENDPQKIKIICVDEGRGLAQQVRKIYLESRLHLAYERSIEEVVDRFEHESFDIMLFSSSVTHQHPLSALEILEIITAKCPETQILFFAHPGRLKIAHQALRAGAFHYSLLPVSDEELKMLIETAMDKKPQLGLNLLLRSEVEKTTFEQMVGRSTPMHQVYRQIRQAAATDIPVLLSGETGTGKELAAQAIHELSDRTNEPCIPVHIGSLPSDLVASELFGHEAGAFTGANALRKGCFELAVGGTIFLDEIATIDQKMQVSLLRLLDTKSFHRLGSQNDIDVDVRVIAASNADLMSEIRRGRFREDLYYRLDVLHIVMPPLRERHGDLHLLVDHFIKQSSEDFQKVIRGVSSNFFSCIECYNWPGNVRELKNVIQRAVINCQEDILNVINLPERLMNSQHDDITIPIHVGMRLGEVENEVIIRTLEYTRHNRTRAAEILGISRRALYNKLQKLHAGNF